MPKLANSQITYECQFQANILMSCSSNNSCHGRILSVNKLHSKQCRKGDFLIPLQMQSIFYIALWIKMKEQIYSVGGGYKEKEAKGQGFT